MNVTGFLAPLAWPKKSSLCTHTNKEEENKNFRKLQQRSPSFWLVEDETELNH